MDEGQLAGFASEQFTRQQPMLSLYQTLAENFYPERADFTIPRNVGNELADGLINSYPILVRRDLGNSVGAMLRDGEWFQVDVDRDVRQTGKGWLQWATDRQRRLFDNRKSNQVRVLGEADHDYMTFGQAVISCTLNKRKDGLLFQGYHLRDCAWWDGDDGSVEGLVRKWSPGQRALVTHFGEDAVHKTVRKDYHKSPFKEIDVRHFWMPSDMYGDEELMQYPWVSIYLDVTHDHVIEAVGLNTPYYVVPRFQTISGSPYAYSPATIVGLPDARASQAMTHTLLEAGERYTRPPIVATQKVVSSAVDLSPDGITWVDNEYDERMGAALRTIGQDRGGFPFGLDLRNGVHEILKQAFFLDTMDLPDIGGDMTAYEVSERMKLFRRQNLPLFSPLESEYSAQVCELAFDVAFQGGLMGSPYDIPQELRGADVRFQFKSPLTSSEEEKKATRWAQVSQMLRDAAAMDQGVIYNVDMDTAFRDAVMGIGADARWLHPREVVMQNRQAQAIANMAGAAMQQGATGNAAG